MSEGYITLSRGFFDTAMWLSPRTYNESEAWLDMIRSARFELSELNARVGGRDVVIRRGEWAASQRFLAKRWRWSDMKVRTFLATLRRNGMITTEMRSGVTIIKLTNYDKYNAAGNAANNAAVSATNTLNVSELADMITQRLTQPQRKPHANTNNENIYISSSSTTRVCTCVREEVECMRGNQLWAEQVCMRFHWPVAELYSQLDAFAEDCEVRGRMVHDGIDDAKSHFVSWVIKRQQANGNNQKRTSEDYVRESMQAGIDETLRFIAEAKRARGEV